MIFRLPIDADYLIRREALRRATRSLAYVSFSGAAMRRFPGAQKTAVSFRVLPPKRACFSLTHIVVEVYLFTDMPAFTSMANRCAESFSGEHLLSG